MRNVSSIPFRESSNSSAHDTINPFTTLHVMVGLILISSSTFFLVWWTAKAILFLSVFIWRNTMYHLSCAPTYHSVFIWRNTMYHLSCAATYHKKSFEHHDAFSPRDSFLAVVTKWHRHKTLSPTTNNCAWHLFFPVTAAIIATCLVLELLSLDILQLCWPKLSA